MLQLPGSVTLLSHLTSIGCEDGLVYTQPGDVSYGTAHLGARQVAKVLGSGLEANPTLINELQAFAWGWKT